MASKAKVEEPLIGSKDLAGLKRQIVLGAVYRSAALVIFTVIIISYLLESELFMPLVAAAMILYVDSLCGLVLAGKMAKPLSYSLKALALTVFLTLLVPYQAEYPAVRELWVPILLVGGTLTIHFLSRAYSEYTGAVTMALLIAGAGFLYYSLFTVQEVEMLSQLTMVALVGLISAAVVSLLGIFKRHGNARIAYIGNLFAKVGNPVIVCAAIALLMTYVLFIRQSLAFFGVFGLTVIEWAALCAGVLLFFIRIWLLMPVDRAQMFGDVEKAAESIGVRDLKNATAKVEEFVREGKKDGLVALMAAALIGNDVPVDEVQDVIAIIIGHEDEKEPPTMFKWTIGNVYEAKRKKRMKAVNDMIAAAVSAVDNARGPTEKHKGAEAPGRAAGKAYE